MQLCKQPDLFFAISATPLKFIVKTDKTHKRSLRSKNSRAQLHS